MWLPCSRASRAVPESQDPESQFFLLLILIPRKFEEQSSRIGGGVGGGVGGGLRGWWKAVGKARSGERGTCAVFVKNPQCDHTGLYV